MVSKAVLRVNEAFSGTAGQEFRGPFLGALTSRACLLCLVPTDAGVLGKEWIGARPLTALD